MLARQLWFGVAEAATGNGMQQLREIAVDQRHDRLALRIAEADIILDQLGTLVGKHQPGIKHSAEGRSCLGHGSGSRKNDLLHRPLLEVVGQDRSGGIGTHSAGIWAGVAFTDALVILCRGERYGVLAVDEREQAGLLALQKLLDDRWGVADRLD